MPPNNRQLNRGYMSCSHARNDLPHQHGTVCIRSIYDNRNYIKAKYNLSNTRDLSRDCTRNMDASYSHTRREKDRNYNGYIFPLPVDAPLAGWAGPTFRRGRRAETGRMAVLGAFRGFCWHCRYLGARHRRLG